ncbi:MAG: uracil-DNA glycosylase [Nitrososphaerales archaeon]
MSSKSIAKHEMKELDEKIIACQLCKLSKSRTCAVPGTGLVENVELVLVGEAPGRNEDLKGRPFVGSGGRLLDELLGKAGLQRGELYITNIVKCRPPNNRKPEREEIEICTQNYLEIQLAILKPKLICSLGATALEYFIGEKKMGQAHGRLTKAKNGIPLLPTYHPASVFRNQAFRELLSEDLARIPKILSALRAEEKQTSLSNFQSKD